MKLLISLFLLIVCSFPSRGQDTLRFKQMAVDLFEALQKNDPKKLDKYDLKGKELKSFCEYYADTALKAGDIKIVVQEKRKNFTEDFAFVRNDTLLHWPSAVIKNTIIETSAGAETDKKKIPFGHVTITVTDNTGGEFSIRLKATLFYNNKWFMLPKRLSLRSENLVFTEQWKTTDTESQQIAEPENIREDTLIWFGNTAAGLQYAKLHNKYAVVYYEPVNCSNCIYKSEKVIRLLKDSYNYYDTKAFNEYYVLILAQAGDTAFLKQSGIKFFPGAAVFTGNKDLLYYKYNMDLNSLLPHLSNYYYTGGLLDQMRIHDFNTYMPQAVRDSKFDTLLIQEYLVTYLTKKSTIYQLYREQIELQQRIHEQSLPVSEHINPPLPPLADTIVMADVSISEEVKPAIKNKKSTKAKTPEPPKITEAPLVKDEGIVYGESFKWEKDTTVSEFNFKIDTAFILEALDSLVIKYNKPDSTLASLIIQIIESTDDYYCPFFVSKLLSGNDTIFRPTVSYSYLFKNYQQLKKYSFGKYYDNSYSIPVYEVLSKRLNRFIRFNETKDFNAIRSALLFQQQFTDAIPELEHLEKPLLITNMLSYADDINIDTLLSTVALPYLDKFIAAKPSMEIFIAALAKTMAKKYKKEINYVIWNNSQPPGYHTETGYTYYYPVYLKEKIGFILNGAAWYYYIKTEDSLLLNKAVSYSAASLKLSPKDPFCLDTYAHLMYKKGNKQAAILYEQRAVNEALKMLKDYEMDKEQVELFKNELMKMKTGKL